MSTWSSSQSGSPGFLDSTVTSFYTNSTNHLFSVAVVQQFTISFLASQLIHSIIRMVSGKDKADIEDQDKIDLYTKRPSGSFREKSPSKAKQLRNYKNIWKLKRWYLQMEINSLKINNMRTRVKAKVYTNKTGNKKIIETVGRRLQKC